MGEEKKISISGTITISASVFESISAAVELMPSVLGIYIPLGESDAIDAWLSEMFTDYFRMKAEFDPTAKSKAAASNVDLNETNQLLRDILRAINKRPVGVVATQGMMTSPAVTQSAGEATTSVFADNDTSTDESYVSPPQDEQPAPPPPVDINKLRNRVGASFLKGK